VIFRRSAISRRGEVFKYTADPSSQPNNGTWDAPGVKGSLLIAAGFFLAITAILTFRDKVVPYRVGQYVPQDVLARVDFDFPDRQKLEDAKQEARNLVPRVYKSNGDIWTTLENKMLDLPDQAAGKTLSEVSPTVLDQFKIDSDAITTQLDSAALTALAQYEPAARRRDYADGVRAYVDALRRLILLNEKDRQEIVRQTALYRLTPRIELDDARMLDIDKTLGIDANPDPRLVAELKKAADKNFKPELQLKLVAFTLNSLTPTHVLDEAATAEAQNQAAARVPASKGNVAYKANQPIKRKSDPINERDWQILKAEHDTFLAKLAQHTLVKATFGTALIALLVTLAICGYIAGFQPRVVKNHARGLGIAILLIAMLMLAELVGMGTGPLYIFGCAPTILVAMILAIAYERRFAMGIGALHGMLVTIALDQPIGFFMVLFVGVLTCCFLLDEVRTRGKLIEVGGVTALAMMLATLATGMASLHPIEPVKFTLLNCVHVGIAALAVGSFVMFILPPIEYLFRITTGMTLLELADMGHPLLRRLAVEAQGTYNHSLQVATLAEAAAEAIGANSLLCRVGSYYHDIGKIKKAEYFVENQVNGVNRHINLTPNVSLLIIIGHVKDGVEMGKEYNLPTSILHFIQQHHGTTRVEYFYHQAVQQQPPDGPSVNESQYRYPGPKPRSRETAIVMVADAVESATRALGEWTASRIEGVVHDLTLKRMTDGQFDECDLTMRELELIERAMIKCMLGIYHGRLAYPTSDEDEQKPQGPAVKSA